MMGILRLFLLCVSFLFPTVASAGGLIRDAEIEATLRAYADPLFRVAGLKPGAVTIFLVQDDSINAFVAGGSNLFIHTGLILESKTPDMLLGVMAHETGHIAGGHLAKGGEKLKDAQYGTILSAVLGAAAAAATGKPEAAAAVITGMGSTMQRNFLSFSRTNENAADQAALGYLDQLGISASGMAQVFELLRRQERQRLGKPDPYLMTHPLSSERIEYVKHHVSQSAIGKGAYPAGLQEKHARMLAKLYGFLRPPEKTLQMYRANDSSVAARMARSIAFFRQARMDESLPLIEGLIRANPADPYLYDLKGQMLFESNRVDDAYAAYVKASKLLPSNALIATDLAKVELARDIAADTASAITRLERAVSMDPENSISWHFLAAGYGRQGNQPMASLALAEKALLAGDVEEALAQVFRAQAGLPESSPAARRAGDLLQRARQMRREQEDADSPL